jgi:fibrillarin-like rRNA methylase
MCGWWTATMYFNYSGDWNYYPNSAFAITPSAVYANGYTYFSDIRLKESISPMTETLELVKMLQPKRFRMKMDDVAAPLRYGFIAQEVDQIFPDLISEQKVIHDVEDGNRLTLDANGIVAISIKALQELIDKVETLERAVYAN